MDEQELLKITDDFKKSWVWVEQRYIEAIEKHKNPQLEPVLKLIQEMQALCYDSIFQAGTSVFDLILSRAKQYGLKTGQAYIRFVIYCNGSGMDVIACGENEVKKLKELPIAFTDKVRILVDFVAAQEIS